MKPIEFPEQNCVYAKDQPEYMPLPAFRDDAPTGDIISCWKLSPLERMRILLTGKMWVSLRMFGQPLTPSYFSTNKSDVLTVKRTGIERLFYLAGGRWRLLFGFCPQCNSDAPELYDCVVCTYNKTKKSDWWDNYKSVNRL
jgi:hypothetical protein